MMNAEQKTLARHALGFPNPKRTSYRNRFVCQESHPEWSAMVANGLATMRRGETLPFGGDACFYLTRKGAEAALDPREKLCPEDFPVVKTRPILFSAPMIRALIDGHKTQTRRILRKQPLIHSDGLIELGGKIYSQHANSLQRLIKDHVPYAVGDRLWVREAWRCNGWATDVATIMYRAHERSSHTEMTEQFPITNHARIEPTGTWKPSMFMPRWISRLTLTVTDVRVQRLQDISEEDAIAEGIAMTLEDSPASAWFSGLHTSTDLSSEGLIGWHSNDAKTAFSDLWNSINGANAWDTNPWVTALTFTVEKRNIDQVPA